MPCGCCLTFYYRKVDKMKKFFYSKKIAPYVFICPFVITVLLFWLVPIFNGALLSFQDVLKNKWVGFDNYSRILTDKIFRKALWNSFKYMTGTLILLIPFPMLFATMLNSRWIKKADFFKSVYFIPALTSVCGCRYDIPFDVWRGSNLPFQSGSGIFWYEPCEMAKRGRNQFFCTATVSMLEMDRCEYSLFSGRSAEHSNRFIRGSFPLTELPAGSNLLKYRSLF